MNLYKFNMYFFFKKKKKEEKLKTEPLTLSS